MNRNPFSLENKTIFVTGASSGIGRAIAIECSKMGATIVITGRNAERLNETFNRLEGSLHTQIIADFQVEEQTKLLIERLPLLDGVVHSAGIVTTLPFNFITKEKLEEILSVNFINPTLISQQLLKHNKINKDASFVWISSISGTFCSFIGNSMYSSTKGAVNGIVKGMALELAKKGIRVNSINSGEIETNILSDGVITQRQIQEEIKKYPLKRYGKPEEIAYAAIYLLSDASKWVTGSHLLIDGGYTLL
jgi:NAD(P)-dependent dehydrogenase (short-subunit alcohol dehydrogenase family)